MSLALWVSPALASTGRSITIWPRRSHPARRPECGTHLGVTASAGLRHSARHRRLPDGKRRLVCCYYLQVTPFPPALRGQALPGAELVHQGLAALASGELTVCSLLVSIGAPRLRRVGFDLEQTFPDPEHQLYQLLAQESGDTAHARYNALIRRLVSFESAADFLTSAAERRR